MGGDGTADGVATGTVSDTGACASLMELLELLEPALLLLPLRLLWLLPPRSCRDNLFGDRFT
jgi:hypothetical protein